MKDLLFLVLGEKPSCYRFNQLEKVINFDNVIFTEYEDNEFSGFYDWLRNSSGQIVGVRYTRLDGFKWSLSKRLQKLSYAKFIHEKIIEIYFHLQRDYVDDLSNDQEIGTCKIYVSPNFTYAIALDILYLTTDEISSIPLHMLLT